jgi:hypothetical protein
LQKFKLFVGFLLSQREKVSVEVFFVAFTTNKKVKEKLKVFGPFGEANVELFICAQIILLIQRPYF